MSIIIAFAIIVIGVYWFLFAVGALDTQPKWSRRYRPYVVTLPHHHRHETHVDTYVSSAPAGSIEAWVSHSHVDAGGWTDPVAESHGGGEVANDPSGWTQDASADVCSADDHSISFDVGSSSHDVGSYESETCSFGDSSSEDDSSDDGGFDWSSDD